MGQVVSSADIRKLGWNNSAVTFVNERSDDADNRAGITGRTRVVGVWGHPVAHSRSPKMHNAALRSLGLDWVYVPFDVDPATVGAAVAGVRALDLVGVNVTVPLKELIAPHLDFVDPSAARIGSVNTIHNAGGELRGYSTDGPGFMRAIGRLGWPTEDQTVCMLGAGGSARAIAFALAEKGNRVVIANRSHDRGVSLADAVNAIYPGSASTAVWGAHDVPGSRAGASSNRDVPGGIGLVVNTTSLGMHPREDDCPPVPTDLLRPDVRYYDLIYTPEETVFLRQARQAGCAVSNGLDMLVQQGAISLSIWSGIVLEGLPLDVMAQAVRESIN